MTKRTVICILALLAAALLAAPASAQRNGRRNQRQQQEEKKPLTRAQKARKMYNDAEALRQTGRGTAGAQLFESMIKEHPTSELVPQAMAKAAEFYGSLRTPDGKRFVELMRKNFPNNQHTLTTYWNPVSAATARDSNVPLKEQIALLEEYLDRYWAQSHFSDVVQRLARALVNNGQTDSADALLSHALAETSPAGMGHMINMIQRGSSSRKDFDNLAKVWGNAANSVDNRTPVYPLLALLEISYLIKAQSLEEAAEKIGALEKLRPKSAFAAYCALAVRPDILAKQEKWAEAAAAMSKAIDGYGIFALPGHTQKLADYQARAENTTEALAILDKLLGQPNWPWKTRELLNIKHGLLVASGDLAAANQVNGELARMFPQTSVSLSARLRSVSALITSENIPKATTALQGVIGDFTNNATAAKSVYAYFGRFDAKSHQAELKALKDEFLKAYPASPESDEIRKQRDVALKDSPTAKAQEVFEEYKSFAAESNVDAARRRIEKLFKEYPSSPHGSTACAELAKALKEADKVELAAELRLLAAKYQPYSRWTEAWLKEAGAAYNGVAKPDKAWPAYDALVRKFRYSRYWRNYVHTAAGTLANRDKLEEAKKLVLAASKSIGRGVQGADLEAFQARRLERQEKWADAAAEMLRILGPNASNPAYRPLAGEAYRFLVVAGLKDQEAQLLEKLANRYEGWDEADRIRISLSTTYARDKKAGKAVKLLDAVQKRHPKYEIGACGHGMIRHLSKYSTGLFRGTVGLHPVQRVGMDMSGGWGNYLYAHTADDMINYALLLNQPEAYVQRMKKRLNKLTRLKVNRPRGYRSGIPYKTTNLPRPHTHPLPEHRWVYGMVGRIDEGMRRQQKRVDPALWLQVYPLWPEYFMNDERIRAAACSLYGRDKGQFNKALAILNGKYNKLVWAPYLLNAQAAHERNHGSRSKAAQLYKTLATKYPDHEHAPAAAQAAKELSGRS